MKFKNKKILSCLIKRHEDGGDISFGKGDFVIQALIILSLMAFAVETKQMNRFVVKLYQS